MPRSSKPRKRYDPRRAARQLREIEQRRQMAVINASTMDADKLRDLKLSVLNALDCITQGIGQEEHIIHLAVASNFSLLLCEQGYGAEFVDEVKQAQEHIMGLYARLNAGQTLALTGPGIQAIRALVQIHSGQVSHEECTNGVLIDTFLEMMERMKAGNVLNPTVPIG